MWFRLKMVIFSIHVTDYQMVPTSTYHYLPIIPGISALTSNPTEQRLDPVFLTCSCQQDVAPFQGCELAGLIYNRQGTERTNWKSLLKLAETTYYKSSKVGWIFILVSNHKLPCTPEAVVNSPFRPFTNFNSSRCNQLPKRTRPHLTN